MTSMAFIQSRRRSGLPTLKFPWRRDALAMPSTKMARCVVDRGSDGQELRDAGRWGDQHDRAAKFSPWLRAAEHSAQQPSSTLRRYESEFKAGNINVLGCSTTMEMGVDIGSIEAVLNSNAPPEIASYRQRVGRAGRQRQPIAVGLTLCKDRPLDRMTIANPLDYLLRQIKTPRVSLGKPYDRHSSRCGAPTGPVSVRIGCRTPQTHQRNVLWPTGRFEHLYSLPAGNGIPSMARSGPGQYRPY